MAADEFIEGLLNDYNNGVEGWGAIDWCNANSLASWAVQTDVENAAAVANQVNYSVTNLNYLSPIVLSNLYILRLTEND